MSPSLFQEEKGGPNLWKLLSMEKTVTYILPPFTVLLLAPLLTAPHNVFSCLYLEMVFKVVTWAIPGSYSVFLSLSHVYRRFPCH